jgi:gas vesicle protein
MFFNDFLDMVNRKKRDEERAKTALKFAVGMGIAATIGLARGILFAPKSGKETREALKKKASETVEVIRNKVKTKAEVLKGTTRHAAQKLEAAIAPKKTAAGKKKS